jgi:KDO2-lipid IV(A) lauroyltransferase
VKPRLKRIKNTLIYHCVAALVWMLGCLPWRLALGVGRALGRLAFRVARRERRRALDNLRQAEPVSNASHRMMVREMFVHLGQNAMECVVMKRLRPLLGTPESPVCFSTGSREALVRALGKGRGVIFITAHLGNWELMAAEIARVAPVAVLRKPSYDPRFTRMIDDFRRQNGVSGIEVGHLKAVLAALARGEILGILLDQPVPTGCQLSFLGRAAWTSTLPVRLQQKTGAEVVTGFIRRVSPTRHVVDIQLISLRNTGEAGIQRLSESIEKAICQTPNQWLWSLDRWRSTETKLLSSPLANSIPVSNG